MVGIFNQPNGAEEALCDPSAKHPQQRLYFWYYVFYISKMYEFIDTLILCLRKVRRACLCPACTHARPLTWPL